MEFNLFGLKVSVTKQKPLTKVNQTTDKKPAQSFDNSSFDDALKAQEVQGRALVIPKDTGKTAIEHDFDYEDDSSVFEDISEFDKEDLKYITDMLEAKEETDDNSTNTEEFKKEQEKRLELFKALLNKHKDNKEAVAQIDKMLLCHELAFVTAANKRYLNEIDYPPEYTYIHTPDMNTDNY